MLTVSVEEGGYGVFGLLKLGQENDIPLWASDKVLCDKLLLNLSNMSWSAWMLL